MRKGIAHVFLIILALALTVAIGFVGYRVLKANGYFRQVAPEGVDTNQVLSIPSEVLANSFGWLTGEPGSEGEIKKFGGAWSRPHPGPFLWDSMQASEGDEIDFSNTDKVVKQNQKAGLATLATLWPFAEWDQEGLSKCEVSEDDEFLPRGGVFEGDMPYLPKHRCSPQNLDAYGDWLSSLIERYDGDGKGDMPGLEIPIRYWEVLNEPDLDVPPGEVATLDFYKEGASEYAELLITSYQIIKQADENAQVLIAGAAGGSQDFLDFYRDVFKNNKARQSFDIANVHCISNDQYSSFNAVPYKKMLREFNIDKPFWITEAEAIISEDVDINATQTALSTKADLKAGAEKIFYTRYNFEREGPGGGFLPPNVVVPETITVQGDNPTEAYQQITE